MITITVLLYYAGLIGVGGLMILFLSLLLVDSLMGE